jgi:3-hydroxybutyryl-CoA dehydrogenase
LQNFPSTNKPIFANQLLLMKIIVLGTSAQHHEFRTKPLPEGAEIFFIHDIHQLTGTPPAFVVFDLSFEPASERLEILSSLNKPIFINGVTTTLKALGLPQNFIRINAWPGFFNREIVEVATGYESQNNIVQTVFQLLQWPYEITPDTPGMISARVIAMIVNEAYFALGEEVSTKEEIDIAMKLGTSYPYGPFEWASKIGLKNIYKLLQKLSSHNSRYTIAPLLEKEAMEI